jgi:hypothetical protein
MGYFKNGAWYPTPPLKLKNCKIEFGGESFMGDFELDGVSYQKQDEIDFIEKIVANQGCEITVEIEDHIKFKKGTSVRVSDQFNKLKDQTG